MANTRGVFTLDRVFTRSRKGTWVLPDQAFSAGSTEPPNIGYYGGGGVTPGRTSAINKIDFSTETRSTIPSALNQTMSAVGGVGSINYGYFVGGYIGSDSSITEKFSYASETSGRAPGLNTSTVRYYVAAAGNTEFAYCNAGAPGYQTRVDKLIYAADVMADSPASYLPTNVSNLGAVASGTSAYFGGGATGASTSTNAVSKTPFATDTNAAIPGTLGLARSACKGTGNEDQGYWFGGTQSGSDKSNTDKITYSSDTVGAAPGANLTTVRYNTGAAGNQSTGYNLGGSPGYTSYCDKTVYSTDTTTAVPGARLSVPTGAMGTFSPRENGLSSLKGYFGNIQNLKGQSTFNFGYINGGSPGGPYLSIVDKVYFNTDTVTRVLTANLSVAGANIGASASLDAAYAAGGARTAQVTIVDKITMATDTAARVPGADLSQASQGLAGCGNKDAGYYAGGTPGSISTMNKLTYSTDSTQGLPAGALSAGRPYLGATSNQRFGYWVGGSGPLSTVDKMDFGTDLTARQPTADLPTPQQLVSGTAGNEDAGYICGGGTPNVSTCTRLNYNVDTSSEIPTAAMSSSRQRVGGTGNINNGYYCGGTVPGDVSTVDKLNFTNDTNFSLPNAKLTGNRSFTSGSSSRMYGNPQAYNVTPTPTTLFPNAPNTGYWVGGEAPRVSNVDKIEYASETVSRSTYGLPELRNHFDGTGNTEKAFYIGGFNPSGPGATSNVQKLVYATDVFSAAPNLNQRRYLAAVTGDLDVGYTSGGAVPASSSSTEKVTFSTEATALVPGANLSATRYSMGNVSNQTAGYALGGAESGPTFSRVDKITFSSETFAYTPGANLSVAKGLVAATGNASVALLIGGQTASKVSDADKLTFSTDTTSAVPSANLPTATGNSAGCLTGNGLNGYFGGGNDGGWTSAMYKVSFSTETTQYLPGRLSQARGNLASSSALESNQVTGVAPLL